MTTPKQQTKPEQTDAEFTAWFQRLNDALDLLDADPAAIARLTTLPAGASPDRTQRLFELWRGRLKSPWSWTDPLQPFSQRLANRVKLLPPPVAQSLVIGIGQAISAALVEGCQASITPLISLRELQVVTYSNARYLPFGQTSVVFYSTLPEGHILRKELTQEQCPEIPGAAYVRPAVCILGAPTGNAALQTPGGSEAPLFVALSDVLEWTRAAGAKQRNDRTFEETKQRNTQAEKERAAALQIETPTRVRELEQRLANADMGPLI